jgi:hypothetical protein
MLNHGAAHETSPTFVCWPDSPILTTGYGLLATIAEGGDGSLE